MCRQPIAQSVFGWTRPVAVLSGWLGLTFVRVYVNYIHEHITTPEPTREYRVCRLPVAEHFRMDTPGNGLLGLARVIVCSRHVEKRLGRKQLTSHYERTGCVTRVLPARSRINIYGCGSELRRVNATHLDYIIVSYVYYC